VDAVVAMTASDSALEFLFLQPGWLLLVFPLLLYLLFRRVRRDLLQDRPDLLQAGEEESLLARHPLADLLEDAGGRRVKRPSTGWLYAASVTCLVISLAEPVLTGEKLPDPPQERDIVFIVDASIAMVLRDYLVDGERIDRMRMLKGVLDAMVRQMADDRIGLIVYGENAYTLVPLTRDQSLLRTMLTRIETTVAGRYNGVGEAIALAVKQTRDQATDDSERRRLLVLMTAGSYPTGKIDDFAAATLAAEAGIPLYVVAIGAGSHSAGEERTSGLIYQPADLERLKSLAALTGADAFRAGDNEALQKTLQEIAERETNPRELPPRHVSRPLYQWPLLAGLLLLVFPQLAGLTGRRRDD
jgi:Ca-activated chloride channel family protein